MEKHIINVKGMGSDHCVAVVKNVIGQIDGANIDFISIGQVAITLDETKANLGTLIQAIEKAGYSIIN